MTEDQIGNLLGALLLLCVVGILAIYVRFGDRRKKGNNRGRKP